MSHPQTAIDYVLGVLLGEGGQQCAARVLYQRQEPADPGYRAVQIVPSGFFGQGYLTRGSLPTLPLREIDGVPLLYGEPVVRRERGRLVVHADLIASAFFLLTRYEEAVRRDVRDRHGRFPGTESLPHRAGFLQRAVVDEYAALLRGWLREVGLEAPEPARRFSVVLTHDLDSLREFPSRASALRVAAAALVGRKSVRRLPRALAVGLGLRGDPLDNLDEIIALDRSLAARPGSPPCRCIYFFMAGGGSEYDGFYEIDGDAARQAVHAVRTSGAGVGLHTSYDASGHRELIAGQKARLEAACGTAVRGNRFHYLSWREIEDGWALADAGIEWDATLGYADVAGFRLGVCRPVPLFDPVRMKPFGIEEHPLLVMDGTLSHPSYMGLDEEAALGCCRRLVDETRKHNGELVVLWHNTKLAHTPRNYHPRLYRRLLGLLADG